MGVEEDRAGGESQIPDTLVKLLSMPEAHRESEDVFEIANGLFRASFVQQLDVCTRFGRGKGGEKETTAHGIEMRSNNTYRYLSVV